MSDRLRHRYQFRTDGEMSLRRHYVPHGQSKELLLRLLTVPQVSRLYHNYSGPLLVPMTLRSLLRMVVQDADLPERAGLKSEDVKKVRLYPPLRFRRKHKCPKKIP